MLNGSRPLVRPGSSISGDSAASAVEKPKRKRQRLDHLTQDEKIMRRKMKNRMAAQTARDRKKLKMTDLESEVTRQSHTNEQLVKKNAVLTARLLECEAENRRLKAQLRRLGHTPDEPDTDSDSASPSHTSTGSTHSNGGAAPQTVLSLLDELGDDIDIDMDEFLRLDNSDVASDDSGYLFSDHSSPGDHTHNHHHHHAHPRGSAPLTPPSSIGSASPTSTQASAAGGAQSWSSPAARSPQQPATAAAAVAAAAQAHSAPTVCALESAAFISEPQQQEQVLTVDAGRRPRSHHRSPAPPAGQRSKVSGYPVIRTAPRSGHRSLLVDQSPEVVGVASMATPMAALWRIAELELASLSSSSASNRPKLEACPETTVGPPAPSPAPRQSPPPRQRKRAPPTTTKHSYNGRLKTFLFLLSAILVLV